MQSGQHHSSDETMFEAVAPYIDLPESGRITSISMVVEYADFDDDDPRPGLIVSVSDHITLWQALGMFQFAAQQQLAAATRLDDN